MLRASMQRQVGRRLAHSSNMPPMTNLASHAAAPSLTVVGAKGVRVTDSSGRSYLEGMAGLWCCGLGWANEELIEAAASQMRDLSYYHSFSGRRVPVADELAEKLIEIAPPSFAGGKVFFGQSGSDANDTQLRLLWMYNRALGRPDKRKVLSRQRGCDSHPRRRAPGLRRLLGPRAGTTAPRWPPAPSPACRTSTRAAP